MMNTRVPTALAAICLFVAGRGSIPAAPECRPAPAGLRITQAEFAHLVRDLSEPEGYFDTDNFVSNEAGYLKVLALLPGQRAPNGCYLGVGPDQNYSYIAEMRPQLSFIIDVRRQNLLQHLYYKALFEQSPTRARFIERLFGRRVGVTPLRSDQPAEQLLNAVQSAGLDELFFARCLAETMNIIRGWNLGLEARDYRTVEYVANSLAAAGPLLRFTSFNRAPRREHPTYRSLILETDARGRQASYLASEARYRVIRGLHLANRIIPVVGDIAGAEAVRRIGAEARGRGLAVTAFYVSNVEFYLFERAWAQYVGNLRALPWSPDGVLIRSYANNWQSHPARLPGYYMTTLLERVTSFLENETAGRHLTYWDLVTLDYIAP